MDETTYTKERENYVKDARIPCQYGTKCYQKNPVHHQKYKHPPKKARTASPPRKKFKTNNAPDIEPPAASANVNDSTSEQLPETNITATKLIDSDLAPRAELKPQTSTSENTSNSINADLGRTPKNFDPKQFIKQKFLVDMPTDFYHFWDFCKELNENSPQKALKNIGLMLVGPYDVLAGKFYDIPQQSDDSYLTHWRYFYDPPEFQTVLKGDNRSGLHIGYVRDNPNEEPVFLAKNSEGVNGIFEVMGDNIFAAVKFYMDDLRTDPFRKIEVFQLQDKIKNKAQALNFDLHQKTPKIRNRNQKIVARSFNKLGIVVPYDKRNQVGYRSLSITNNELTKLLDKIQKALPEQKQKYISDLQPILTNTLIATDECDFGTGIELGLNILAHGVGDLNRTVSNFLASNYRLIHREVFAKIIEAHMKNRNRGTKKNLSIV